MCIRRFHSCLYIDDSAPLEVEEPTEAVVPESSSTSSPSSEETDGMNELADDLMEVDDPIESSSTESSVGAGGASTDATSTSESTPVESGGKPEEAAIDTEGTTESTTTESGEDTEEPTATTEEPAATTEEPSGGEEKIDEGTVEPAKSCPGAVDTTCSAFATLDILVTGGRCSGKATASCDVSFEHLLRCYFVSPQNLPALTDFNFCRQ